MAGGLLLFHGEETMNRVLLSVITPTYNRGELLKNCFSSLRAQTDDRFEWIIVDDGSTDDTAQIVSGFCNSAPQMHIVYVQKENGGKHTALNAAHPHIRGKYVLILDSDDVLTDDAVAVVLECWSRWENHSEVGIVTLLNKKQQEVADYGKDKKLRQRAAELARSCAELYTDEHDQSINILSAKDKNKQIIREAAELREKLDGAISALRNTIKEQEDANSFLNRLKNAINDMVNE